jgi:hypothetical protein
MADPRKALGSPWPPLAIRPCKEAVERNKTSFVILKMSVTVVSNFLEFSSKSRSSSPRKRSKFSSEGTVGGCHDQADNVKQQYCKLILTKTKYTLRAADRLNGSWPPEGRIIMTPQLPPDYYPFSVPLIMEFT